MQSCRYLLHLLRRSLPPHTFLSSKWFRLLVPWRILQETIFLHISGEGKLLSISGSSRLIPVPNLEFDFLESTFERFSSFRIFSPWRRQGLQVVFKVWDWVWLHLSLERSLRTFERFLVGFSETIRNRHCFEFQWGRWPSGNIVDEHLGTRKIQTNFVLGNFSQFLLLQGGSFLLSRSMRRFWYFNWGFFHRIIGTVDFIVKMWKVKITENRSFCWQLFCLIEFCEG